MTVDVEKLSGDVAGLVTGMVKPFVDIVWWVSWIGCLREIKFFSRPLGWHLSLALLPASLVEWWQFFIPFEAAKFSVNCCLCRGGKLSSVLFIDLFPPHTAGSRTEWRCLLDWEGLDFYMPTCSWALGSYELLPQILVLWQVMNSDWMAPSGRSFTCRKDILLLIG